MKILVVDDDDNIRLIAQMALGDDDVIVVGADSGKMALELAAQEKPDLILLDMMMPDMDGKTTCAQLKQLPGLKSIPVIFLTAKVQAPEIDSYKTYGAAGIITKPFDPMTLGESIDRILKESV